MTHADTASEMAALEQGAAGTARGQRGWATWWRFVETWAGLAVALLSALAGVTVLADDKYQAPAVVLALTASALSAVLGFVRPGERARKAETLALLCEEFERRARYERVLTLPGLDAAGARDALMVLADRWNTIRWDDLRDQLDPGPPITP